MIARTWVYLTCGRCLSRHHEHLRVELHLSGGAPR